MTVREKLKSPFAKVSGGVAAIGAILRPDVLFAFSDALLASAPQIFSGLTVGALTLPQFLPPQSTVDWVLVGAAALFIAYLAKEINDNFDREGL
ncbi:hypothetical protein EXE43_05630 [Halorubrum sp. SS5]|nr:hypothetical protein EXE43_05630 [Halorubrum sp. SS5]